MVVVTFCFRVALVERFWYKDGQFFFVFVYEVVLGLIIGGFLLCGWEGFCLVVLGVRSALLGCACSAFLGRCPKFLWGIPLWLLQFPRQSWVWGGL